MDALRRRLMRRPLCLALCSALLLLCFPSPASSQSDHGAQPPEHGDSQGPRDAESTGVWRWQADGTLFATVNWQGGRRGDTDVRAQNWLMGMASRPLGTGTLTLSGMLALEPWTVGQLGYSQIFQVGEAWRGLQITDHQHPHDLFMQLAAAWSVPLGDDTRLTVAGAPIGEAALGPAAFMHRASSAENPTAPLSHHVFDSTHLANDVILARVDRGRLAFEASAFHGREPDETRHDLDGGALDSWSARGWLRVGRDWTAQVSHGYLHEPEALEPGNQRRTNASVSWFHTRDRDDFSAVTIAVGRTARAYSTLRAVLAEATHRMGRTTIYGRAERTEVETEILLFPSIVHVPHPGELVDPVSAFTAGAIRDLGSVRGLLVGIGGDVTRYRVPALLQVTHGASPTSAHLFVRIRPSGTRQRMWNVTMGDHGGHDRHADHAGHVH